IDGLALEIDVDEGCVVVRGLDQGFCAIEGRRRPDNLATCVGQIRFDLHRHERLVLDDEDTLSVERAPLVRGGGQRGFGRASRRRDVLIDERARLCREGKIDLTREAVTMVVNGDVSPVRLHRLFDQNAPEAMAARRAYFRTVTLLPAQMQAAPAVGPHFPGYR